MVTTKHWHHIMLLLIDQQLDVILGHRQWLPYFLRIQWKLIPN